MKIQTITKFKMNGVEYDTLAHAKKELENSLGRVIDSAELTRPSDRLKVLNAIIDNRELLVSVLDTHLEDGDGLEVSVFLV